MSMPTQSSLTLAQDLCARLCHDLVGPLGTMAGALELLEEDAEAAALAREAAASLRARLQLWRAACGAGTGPMTAPEMAALLEGVLGGGRVTADVTALPPGEAFAPGAAQLLLVAALLAGEALPRGGVVRLAPAQGGVAIQPAGRVVAWPPAVEEALAGQVVEGPRLVLAPILVQLAQAAGWAVSLSAEVLTLRPM
jgi:histidine phosphotransferase ChpT